MFTGIVQAIGRVRQVTPRGGDVELLIESGTLDLARAGIGDSIAVGGVCLSVTHLAPGAFAADVSRETLARTVLGGAQAGDAVNLEPALRAGDPCWVLFFCPGSVGDGQGVGRALSHGG